MVYFFMPASLILGLTAWALPVAALFLRRSRAAPLLCVLSLSCCSLSLCFQIQYSAYLVQISDVSAILDTAGGSAVASGCLLTVALLLNAAAILLWRLSSQKNGA